MKVTKEISGISFHGVAPFEIWTAPTGVKLIVDSIGRNAMGFAKNGGAFIPTQDDDALIEIVRILNDHS